MFGKAKAMMGMKQPDAAIIGVSCEQLHSYVMLISAFLFLDARSHQQTNIQSFHLVIPTEPSLLR